MIQAKEKLIEYIRSMCERNIADTAFQRNAMEVLRSRYDIPVGISSDILTLRDTTQLENPFIAFCLLDTVKRSMLPSFFTETEIEGYSKAKYIKPKVTFPLRFQMIQVAPDQWIGSITAQKLMQFASSQLIRYNANTQRTMRRVVSGNTEYFKININKKAVASIEESLEADTFIPNTITLNMPEDTSFSFQNGELRINQMSQFDILDGYHRYVAISKAFNKNNNFDYNMELRIAYWPEEKAQRFISQEDKKTKMLKIDSDSFDMDSIANRIVQRLNMDPLFVLSGQISRNAGIINAPEMAKLINVLWKPPKKAKRDVFVQLANQIREQIKEGMETIIGEKPQLLNQRWDFRFLSCVMVAIFKGNNNIETVKKYYSSCDKDIRPSMNYSQKGLIKKVEG